MNEEGRLAFLASSILEGKPIDWPAAESTSDPDDRAIVQQLQVVAEIAALHRDPALVSRAVPRAAPVSPAKTQWGHLRLLERVGHGTFGDVFRAWDTHLDREVALKLLRTDRVVDDMSATLTDPARVVNEGRLLARVRHPHVITVYGAEPRDGSVGIWMEFIHGKTLEQFLAQHGPMSAREAVTIGTDLCRALAAVHGAGLLHRDVTARNVMREEGGRVVLMDFGVGHDVRETPDGQNGNDVAGTPLYLAPELFKGGRANQRTDIYALGTLLFHLVTRSFPVRAASIQAIGAAHDRGERTRLRDLRPDLPAAFVRVVEKAVAGNPMERYETAGAFDEALDHALGESRARVVVPRHLRFVAALAAALAATVAATSWWVVTTPPGDAVRQPGGRPADVATTGLVVRKGRQPAEFWPFSNPSADGRFRAGLMSATGDVGLMDLTTGEYRALGMGKGDYSDGYASLGALSPDGTTVAVDWHDDAGGSLRIIRSDGTGERTLIPTPGDVWIHGWSSDGSMILAVIGAVDGSRTIGLVAAADGAIRPIRSLTSSLPDAMSLSPDGRYIAYDFPKSNGSDDREVVILDAHTGNQWPLGASAGQDSSPLWSPDGRSLVFLSDRNRTRSLWLVAMEQGRGVGEPRLVRDDIGRVWLRGFTASGALHYQLAAGHAEVYVASTDPDAPTPEPLSPRDALSNFYPVWSRDGRFLAYSSERMVTSGRDLWVYDTVEGRESHVPSSLRVDRPVQWSADGTQLLAANAEGQRLHLVERLSGRTRPIADGIVQPSWGPAGILYRRKQQVILADPGSGRTIQAFSFDDSSVGGFAPSADGRSVLVAFKNGRMVLRDIVSGRLFEWSESPGTSLARFRPRSHLMAPHAPGVVYIVNRAGMNGEITSLMFWGGSGTPRELLRAGPSENFALAGWYGGGEGLLVTRWTTRPNAPDDEPDVRTLWRVPIVGGPPVATRLAMEGLRDISISPDGRRIAFNAGWKRGEQWVMENLLPK